MPSLDTNSTRSKSLIQRIFRQFIAFVVSRYGFFRLIFFAAMDFSITFISFIAAIFIYTRVIYVDYTWWMIYSMIGIAFFIKLAFFGVFRVYNISFQYASALYISKTSSVIFLSALVNYFILRAVFPGYWFPTISVIAFLLDIFTSVSFRFFPLVYQELCARSGEQNQNCLVYGCGDTGKSLMPILQRNKVKIEGFIDDSPNNINKVISGVKVLGRLEDLGRIVNETKVDVLIIAIPSLDGGKTKKIRQICSELNIVLKTIPSLSEIYNKDIEEIARAIRTINYDDLLRRPVKRENFSALNAFFEGKKVIVTGVGSIGKELITQLLNFKLDKILALDNCELNLFELENIIDKKQSVKITKRLLDLKNAKLLKNIVTEFRPDIVFHTAAYKHVPIVEENVCEGVLNNLSCLKNIYEASEKAGAKRFIFISSDKAVRPTNVMGATKRLGELFIQSMNEKQDMISCSVRFGNVMGSSGSLVPRIMSQIENNRVVTITHPEASRFFMLTSEAVLLILKASTIADGGEIFILDMGVPIKIKDLVNDIISFYGKTVREKVDIEYIGLRPGEKILEELFLDEVEQKEYKDGLFIARASSFDYNKFLNDYDALISISSDARQDETLNMVNRYAKIYTNEELLKERDHNESIVR